MVVRGGDGGGWEGGGEGSVAVGSHLLMEGYGDPVLSTHVG